MKQSKYNMFSMYNDSSYVGVNLITGGMMLFDKDEYNNVKSILEDPNNFDDSLGNDLNELGFIVPDTRNELKLIQRYHWEEKLDKDYLNITILPTFGCNFKCVYCYQQCFSQEDFIKSETLESIYKFIENKINDDGVKKVAVSWFGGEVLLCLNHIKDTGIRIKELCERLNVEYDSTITTNGYELTREKINILKLMGVARIETTLAGSKDAHNLLRPTKNGQPTFDKIINNIKIAREYFPIVLMINVTKNNYYSMTDLLDLLKEKDIIKNVYVNFRRVTSYGMKQLDDICMTKTEYSREFLKLYKYCMDIGLNAGNLERFRPTFLFCHSLHENSFAIDMNGYVYSCIEVYDKNSNIGYISSDGELIENLDNYDVVDDIFSDEKCVKCNLLPYCMGGCYQKRKVNEDCCPDETADIEGFLNICCEYELSK